MTDNYLPPVVTQLQGEIADLLGKLAEAQAALQSFNDENTRRSEAAGRTAGQRGGQGLVDEFRRALDSAKTGIGGDFGRIVGDFEKLSQDAGNRSGQSFASRFLTSVKNALLDTGSSGGGLMKQIASVFATPAGAPVAAALAATVGAMVGGVLLGAFGAAGLAAGIVGQIQNPAVKQAITDLGQFAKTKFQDASASFHDPIIQTVADLKTLSVPIFDTLKQNFNDLAPYLKPFVDSIAVFFRDAAPGWIKAVQAAGPILAELAKSAQIMGGAFSFFFQQLADSGPGATEGLRLLIVTLAALVEGLGALIHVLSAGFDILTKFDDWLVHLGAQVPVLYLTMAPLIPLLDYIKNGFGDTGVSIGSVADKFAKAAEASSKLTTDLDRQKAAVDKLTASWDKWFGLSMTLDQANLTLHQDMTALTDSIAQNGRTWDLNTKSGQANYQTLLQAIQGAHDYRQAQIDAGGSVDQANKAYQANIDWIFKQAQNAGLDKQQIQQLRDQVAGLTDSLNSLNGRHIDYFVDGIFVNGNQNYQGPPSQFYGSLALGGLVRNGLIRAAQGFLPPRDPGTLVLAGEPQTGGEVMIPQRGISQRRAAALGTVALAPYGLGVGVPGGDAGGVVENHIHVEIGGQEIAHVVDMLYPNLMARAGQRRRSFGNSGLSTPFSPAYPTGNTFGGG